MIESKVISTRCAILNQEYNPGMDVLVKLDEKKEKLIKILLTYAIL